MKKSISALFFCCTFMSLVVTAENVFFIRLNIDENCIELGEFNNVLQKEVKEILPANEEFDLSVKRFEKYLENKISPDEPASILFFLHAMWGSNNWFVKSQVIDFSESYIHDPENPIDYVFYILWDTKAITYEANKNNSLQSSALLNRLFSILYAINPDDNYNYNLMCHCMGNKIFFDLLESEHYEKRLFDHVILAAPDINKDKLTGEQLLKNLEVISGKCHILYNKNDGLLMLSSIRNFYKPLGLHPDISIAEKHSNIEFINCSFLTDNNRFPSSVTGHLYYSTSIATKRKIKSILSSQVY
ncbi:MAG: alpha/beta hydrolase [Fimbriimonadaceae bacterium]|nr:alpha/beta hydrolase [Chitinophagales bacterium]